MDTQQQLDRLTGIVESLAAGSVDTRQQLDRLSGIVGSLAASVVEHDDQIESLIKVAQKHQEEMAELRRSIAETERLWQAYLKRLPPQ